jgi:hypothetical protein
MNLQKYCLAIILMLIPLLAIRSRSLAEPSKLNGPLGDSPKPAFTSSPTPVTIPPPLSCELKDAVKVHAPLWILNSGSESSFYVSHDNAVDRYSLLEKGLKGVIPANQPMGLAEGRGNLYVVERGAQRVSVYDSHEKPLIQWGSLGSGPGQFNNPAGIAFMEDHFGPEYWKDRVFVADEGNHRIEYFSGQGEPITQWGNFGKNGHGTFDRPYGIAVNQDGNLYVCDQGTGLVQIFDQNQNWVNQWDVTKGTGLTTAAYIAVVESNGEHIFVTDGKGPIVVFDSLGKVQGYLNLPGGSNWHPAGIGFEDGLLVADPENGEIDYFWLTDPIFDESDD